MNTANLVEDLRKLKMKINFIVTTFLAGLFLGSGITGFIFIFSGIFDTTEMVTEYEQELRVQHEYLKACDAQRMYQGHVLDKNGIDYIH